MSTSDQPADDADRDAKDDAAKSSSQEDIKDAVADNQGDTSRKSYRDILIQEIIQGIAEYERPTFGLFLSGVAAGLEIGFSVLLMAVMLTLATGQFRYPVVELLVANMYSFGFILVILGRSELFTEHTTLAVLPVLARQFPLRGLMRVWGVVYSGNLLGGLAFTCLLVWIAPARHRRGRRL